MKAPVFLSAEWRKLIIANYVVSPELLRSIVPAGTELDFFEGKTYVSLVGFMFMNTKLKGLSIPYHRNFEEVNLRFYVRRKEGNDWKRGVVFVKEIVPKSAVTLIANTLYNEKYVTMPMKHEWSNINNHLYVSYQWKSTKWNSFKVIADPALKSIDVGSAEEFITEHYWGYNRISSKKTMEYGVQHPRWNRYDIQGYYIDADFENLYGGQFAFLNQEPESVMLAEGSPITVLNGRRSLKFPDVTH